MAHLLTRAFLSEYYYLLIKKQEQFEMWLARAAMPAESRVTRPGVTMTGVLRAIDCLNYILCREQLDSLCIETPAGLSPDTPGGEPYPQTGALLCEYPYLIELEGKYNQLITADKAHHLQDNILQIAFSLYDSLHDMEKSHLRLLSLMLERKDQTNGIEGRLADGSIGAPDGSLPCSATAAGPGGATTVYTDDGFALSVSPQDLAILDEAISFRRAWDDFFSKSIMKAGEFYHTLYQAVYEGARVRNLAFYNDVKNGYPQIADTFFPEYVRRRVEDNYNELDYPFENIPDLTFRKMISTMEDYFRSNGVNPSANLA